MDSSLNKLYVEDMKVIKKILTPFMKQLEENEVDIFSVTMFFSSYVKELLKEIDDKNKKEIIVRNMLDWYNVWKI